MTIGLGAIFVDPGVSALDDEDGNLTDIIISSGSVDTSILGTYIIKYTVTDSDGNSNSITRTVEVIFVEPLIYFEDGICKCPDAIVGDSFEIEGVLYIVVDNLSLIEKVFLILICAQL